MRFLTAFVLCAVAVATAATGQQARLTSPNGGETFRPGTSQNLTWDTTGVAFSQRWKFQFATNPSGPWTDLSGATNVKDSGSTRGVFAGGFRVPATGTSSGYVKMVSLTDETNFDISDNPFTIVSPAVAAVDSTLRGEITGTVRLSRTKVYGLDGYVFVNSGATLHIEAGTVIVGDTVGQNSVLCINRGGKIVAEGTRTSPIVFTSRAAPGQRAAGDWGGIVICGNARINSANGQQAIEGGIADATPGKGWYGGQDDDDSSGVLRYVRIEFAGIAVIPNSELNSLTMGGVGRRTVIDYVQCSFNNDDAFEWFGGSVNARHLIAYGTLDDDFDCDFGYSGKVQFALAKRFRTVADVSTSQTFEIDNDGSATYNRPFTSPVFSNVTSIGPIQDTNWTPGNGQNQFSSRFGAAAQIRRNARAAIYNAVFVGWPRGLEIAQLPTMIAASLDSVHVRHSSWFGVKGAWMNLAGLSGGQVAPAGFDAQWVAKAGYGNDLQAASPNLAQLRNPFSQDVTFNPVPQNTAPYLASASFRNDGIVNIEDPFFERVNYRGAFSGDEVARWDAGWANYDPVNTEYRASVNVVLLTPGAAAGEQYTVGSKVAITWDTLGTRGQRFSFDYAPAITGPWTSIQNDVTDDAANRGRFEWTAPATPVASVYLRMRSSSDANSFDIITNPIAIVAAPQAAVRLIEPGTSTRTIRVGQSVSLAWDTTNTFRERFSFEFGKSPNGPWRALAGLSNVLDSTGRRGTYTAAFVLRPEDETQTGYIKMTLLSDPTRFDINDEPITVVAPQPTAVDSTLRGEITGYVKLHNTKIYGLDGYVFVNEGATLEIEPGTIIVGDTVGQNSVLCINRGGYLVAKGTPQLPIVFTSRATVGQRAAGDWGGIVLCGKARINPVNGQSAIEGGIADANAGGKGWYGGQDDDDSSGVLQYVRIEFAGIAVIPNSELNSLTMGGVGRRTVIDHVQCSYNNDDAFEWFGGTVNAKHLVAVGTLDDDFDCDFGYTGKVQFALAQRFRTVADQSTSQTFEIDNDGSATYNRPYTSPTFSNVTSVGPIQDTNWTVGNGANQYSSRFGAAVQIRRNARANIHNSAFIGWPRGIEIAQLPTMLAASQDSLEIRNNAWYGIKGSWMNLAGLSGGQQAPEGFDAQWIAKQAYGNTIDKSSPAVAGLMDPFKTNVEFNPALGSGSPLASGAVFSGTAGDAFFERVAFRGAFGMERWDLPWTNYNPVNTEYKAQEPVSVREDDQVGVGITGMAFPNPSVDASVIRYQLASEDVVTIRVLDAIGALKATFFANTAQSTGVYEFRLVTVDLAPGVYYVTISGNRGTATVPVTVVR